ncbi:MAG TPA: glutamate-1-semialdehyde 2,1-aminomutase [Fimbriimonadaceae bacterium]|jgi:glutamate-1-semialdehyde 2,1-aminomutase
MSVGSAYSTERSSEFYRQAVTLMPGGVNSPVRAFRGVGGNPLFFKRALGSKLFDVDGNEYLDYVSSWGAIILGHADPMVTSAIAEAAANGASFGAPHEGEIKLATEVLSRMPILEKVRFVNSGSEATTAAIRVARAATSRSKVLKFDGNYHGAVDSLLAKAGSGVATFGLPDSAGVPAAVVQDTLVARYNDLGQVRAIFEANPDSIAAVLVEPVVGNMGCVPPAAGFLEGLRSLTLEFGALLVIDEVMTGFRVSRGGACSRFGIDPDLVCMGKVIGGGLPVGAYGGKRRFMDLVAPVGPVYQAGTLSGNPIAMAAGHAALSQLSTSSYEELEALGSRLESGLRSVLTVPARVQRCGSMISVFFTSEPVVEFDSANKTDRGLYARLFHALLKRGIYLPPSALESWFFTLSHSESDIDFTIEQFGAALKEVA